MREEKLSVNWIWTNGQLEFNLHLWQDFFIKSKMRNKGGKLMITSKGAYEIAKNAVGPYGKITCGYETETHFVFLRKHTMGKLLTDNASFWIDKNSGALKILSAIPSTKEFETITQGKPLAL